MPTAPTNILNFKSVQFDCQTHSFLPQKKLKESMQLWQTRPASSKPKASTPAVTTTTTTTKKAELPRRGIDLQLKYVRTLGCCHSVGHVDVSCSFSCGISGTITDNCAVGIATVCCWIVSAKWQAFQSQSKSCSTFCEHYTGTWRNCCKYQNDFHFAILHDSS